MKYDIVKDKFATAIAIFPFLRKVFYKLLNTFILRQQYVFKMINKVYKDKNESFSMYDAGGGFLQYSDFVLDYYPNSKVHAVDIKENYLNDYSFYVNQSKKEGRFSYKVADLQEYTPKNKYDLIIAIDILEHIENDRQTISNFSNCISQHGKLIISTPSTFDEAAAYTEEHVRPGYDMDELVEKLHDAGFKIDSIRYTYGKYGAKYWKYCMKIPMQLFQKTKLAFIVVPAYLILMYPFLTCLMKADQKANNEQGNGILVVASLDK